MFLFHYYVPEKDTREECEMSEKEELQFQEIFPKCTLSPVMFQKNTREEEEMDEEEEFQFLEKIMSPKCS